MFDWDRFKNGEIAVHCNTEGKADDFLKECEKRFIKWISGDKATDHNNYSVMKTRTCYYSKKNKLTYCEIEHFEMRDIPIVKWEGKELKELTFKEVIANIKNGEVWECGDYKINKNFAGIYVENPQWGLSFLVTDKFKLKRKEYIFEEAFKSYEEGKEIESFRGISYKKDYEAEYNEDISIGEIRGKWYIND